MNNWIVAKFGGSSVRDAVAMLRCSQIIENNPAIKVVVISATQNTTNQLEYVAQAALRGDQATLDNVTKEVIEKHLKIAQEIYASHEIILQLETLFSELKELGASIFKNSSYTPKTMDHLYSIGERMSSLLFSDLLRLRMPARSIHFVDARKIIKTNSHFQKADANLELIDKMSREILLPLLNTKESLVVTQGFIGEDLQGNTTTLGREGSDYSAALFGEAIDASAIQIWTDVQGIASSDPRIVSDVVYISRLSYDEATELATLGAKVLFPTTLLPAKRKFIPVYVGSSLNSDLPMTIIENKMQEDFSLKAVTIQKEGDEQVLSFVGSNLSLNKSLKDVLLAKLNSPKENFTFFKITELSISFLVIDNDVQMALRHGHLVLKSF